MTVNTVKDRCRQCGEFPCSCASDTESADAAMAAVHAFADARGLRDKAPGIDIPQYTKPLQAILVDLLAGLLHYCEREEQDFDRVLLLAKRHYIVERIP